MADKKRNVTALITGASGGLGREFARLCAADGYDVVLSARNEEKLNDLKNELEENFGVTAFVCAADLSEKDAALKIFAYTSERKINVGILINNAGFGDTGSFCERNPLKQTDMIQVNITALVQLTHCYLKPMTERGSGKILNVSSIAAFSAGPYMSVYYASKAFVRSFSEAIAEEARGTGVSVTSLCPGPTATGFVKAAEMGNPAVFRNAAKAEDVAKAGYEAMKKGKALCYCGAFTKIMSIAARAVPRFVARKFAGMMNSV